MTFPIIPKHVFEAKDMSKTGKFGAPIGTGPYKFDFYDGKKSVMLVRNDRWVNPEPVDKEKRTLPYIKNVEVKIYENSREAISAFQTRDIDMTSVKSGEFMRYGGRTDLVIRKYPGRKFEFVALNLSKPALGDKAVRQAIVYAIDKNHMVNDILSNQATPSELPVLPETWLYDANASFVNSDKIKAKQLLTDNGWSEKNGLFSKRINGVSANLDFELLVNEENKIRAAVAERLKDELKQIGINITIKSVKWEDELKSLETRKYDMAILGCSIPSVPDISFLYSSPFIPAYQFSKESVFNMSGYNNLIVNDYVDRIFKEKDNDRKKALFINMKAILNDEVPYVGLYFYDDAILFNKRVRGNLDPYVWNLFNDISQWYIPSN
jgi:peptide/nickel transport system substrate-binding protein